MDFPLDHTPAEWREMATDCHRRRVESIDNCDTDGFLSQWALDQLALRYLTLADLAESGGRMETTLLADLHGNLLDAREVNTRYGWAWVITNPDGTTSWFNESEARRGRTRMANNAKKGYQMLVVSGPVAMNDKGHLVVITDDPDELEIVGVDDQDR